ncbi:MAG: hypothetical protein ACYDCL_14155 [Myxococcales bacterium]
MRAAAAAGLLALAGCTSPPPPPTLPGSFVGAFQLTATLVPPGEDAGLPQTTCPLDLDAGFSAPPSSLTVYAYLSEAADAGGIEWQILGGPAEPGTLTGGAFSVQVESCAPITGCGCVAAVAEQVVLSQRLPDGGPAPALSVPVLSLTGWIEDTLSTAAAGCLDAGTGQQACSEDAGPGCGLGAGGSCSVVYQVVGVPGLPGS